MTIEPWQERHKAFFGEYPKRQRSKITDDLNQDNANDYSWEERFEIEKGRPPTSEERADFVDMLNGIFGTNKEAS
jgi:hypothetical protein